MQSCVKFENNVILESGLGNKSVQTTWGQGGKAITWTTLTGCQDAFNKKPTLAHCIGNRVSEWLHKSIPDHHCQPFKCVNTLEALGTWCFLFQNHNQTISKLLQCCHRNLRQTHSTESWTGLRFKHTCWKLRTNYIMKPYITMLNCLYYLCCFWVHCLRKTANTLDH